LRRNPQQVRLPLSGVLRSACKCVLATPEISLSHRMGEGWGEGYSPVFLMQLDWNRKPLTLTLSHPMGEGIHWRRAEFVGLMPRHVRRSDSPHLGSGY